MEGQTFGGGGNWGYPPYPGYDANANANADENQFTYDPRSATPQLQLFGGNAAVGTSGYYNYNGNVNTPVMKQARKTSDYMPVMNQARNTSDYVPVMNQARNTSDYMPVMNQARNTSDYMPVMNQARKASDYTEDEKKLKLQMSLNNHADGLPCTGNSSAVSTGLKLSYEDNEHNSSTTSATGSMPLPTTTTFVSEMMAELEKGNKEIDNYFRSQAEQFSKRVRVMQMKQLNYFTSTMNQGFARTLREKELQLQTMNRRSQELNEQIRQFAIQAQSWQSTALHNESVANSLKSQLMQVVAEHANRTREGQGDSEEESAAPSQKNNTAAATPGAFFESSLVGSKDVAGGSRQAVAACRWCGAKEAVVLVMPCRHLCLCVDCERIGDTCPVCQFPKSGSVEINMS